MKYRNKTKENKTKQNRILRFYQHYYNLKTSLCRGVLWYDCPSKNHDLNFFFLRWIIYHFFFFFFFSPVSFRTYCVTRTIINARIIHVSLCTLPTDDSQYFECEVQLRTVERTEECLPFTISAS